MKVPLKVKAELIAYLMGKAWPAAKIVRATKHGAGTAGHYLSGRGGAAPSAGSRVDGEKALAHNSQRMHASLHGQ